MTTSWEGSERPRRAILPAVLILLSVVVVVGLLSRSPAEPDPEGLPVSESDQLTPTTTAFEPAPDPVTGRWLAMATAPFRPTSESEGVWADDQLLVWDHSDTGAMVAYDPDFDRWTQLDTAPVRTTGGHAMVWTGTEVLIWGGTDISGQASAEGLRFSPQDGWSVMPPSPLSARTNPGAAWDTSRERLIIWGGDSVGLPGERFPADGASYDPVSDTWQPLPDLGLSGRVAPAVLALDEGVAVVGGHAGPTTYTDGVLLVDQGLIAIPEVPAAFDQRPVFTAFDSQVIAWGRPERFEDPPGYVWTAGEGWQLLPRLLNQERAAAIAVVRNLPDDQPWLILWGGLERRGTERVTDGFWLNLSSEQWRAFAAAPLSARSDAVVVTTASELIVWGGSSGGTHPRNGARLGLPPRQDTASTQS